MSDWKATNYNRKIRVSSTTVEGLRKGGSFSANVKKFKSTGMTAEQREAMNRFYGKNRVNAAFGSTTKAPSTKARAKGTTVRTASAKPSTFSTGQPQAPRGAAGRSAAVSSAPKTSWAKRVGSFAANELLGVDDVRSAGSHLKKREFKSAAKSVGQAGLEIGTTVGAVASAVPTGGGSLVAKGAMIGAKQAAKQGAKSVTKQAVKSGAKKVVKAAATGSPVKGAKAVVKSPGTAVRAVSKAKTSAKMNIPEYRRAATTAAAAEKATAAQKAAKAAHSALVAAPGGKAKAGVGAAYDARKAATIAARAKRTEAARAGARVAQKEAAIASRKAKRAVVRKGTKRVIVGRAIGASYNKYNER